MNEENQITVNEIQEKEEITQEEMLQIMEQEQQVESLSSSSSGYISPTIANLPTSSRPNPSTICESCPASLWMVTPKNLTCFCQLMRLKTYTSEEPAMILKECDGVEKAYQMMDQ